MKKYFYISILIILFSGCAVTSKIKDENVQLKFLDEYIFPGDFEFENTKIGGLSGIDYKNGIYYLVCDQASNPRIYEASIEIKNDSFKKIAFNKEIPITKTEKFTSEFLDLEAVRFDINRKEFLITSEGLIEAHKNPGIYKVSENGEITASFQIPDYFKANGEQRPRNNGVFEGLTESFDQRGYWVATELPLTKDGAKPKIFPTRSHVRITKYDKNTGKPVKQFVYKLDGISKLPINYFAVNGVTEILEYKQDKFLILERAYSAGYGSHGNTVKIFDIDASKATNTLEFQNLRKEKYKKVKKRLIFNFKSVRKKLTDEIVDNIEGMCFGPKLTNSKQSLILISDNNFNSFGKQLNQFILLEVSFKNRR